VMQVGIYAGAYLLYALGRYVAIGDYSTAADHAHAIVQAERSLGIAVEGATQRAVEGTPWLWLLNHVYLAAQLVVVPAALAYLYPRAPAGYRRLRNVLLATWLISLPIYALFPVAPPRLADPGIADTISHQTGFALNSRLTTSLYNPLAAVPSLHAGFALAVGLAVARYARARWLRALALAWPLVVGLAVIATGNHFVLDIAAGAAVTLAGFGAALWVESLDPGRHREVGLPVLQT
jgi:PAP2 superfamily